MFPVVSWRGNSFSSIGRHSQVVRQESAKLLSPVQIRVPPPIFLDFQLLNGTLCLLALKRSLYVFNSNISLSSKLSCFPENGSLLSLYQIALYQTASRIVCNIFSVFLDGDCNNPLPSQTKFCLKRDRPNSPWL